MAEFRRTEILSGLFIVLAVVIFTVLVFRSGSGSFEFLTGSGDQREFVALVPHVHGLQADSPVRWKGLTIGKVLDLGLVFPGDPARTRWGNSPPDRLNPAAPWPKVDEAAATVRFVLRRSLLPQAQESDARLSFDALRTYVHVRQDGLIGDWYVELVEVDRDPARSEERRESMFQGAALSIWGRSDGMVERLATFFEGMEPAQGDLVGILAKINRQVLSDQNLGRIDQTMADLTATTATAKTALESLEALLAPTGPRSLDRRLIPRFLEVADSFNAAVNDLQARGKNTLEGVDRFLLDTTKIVSTAVADLDLAERSRQVGQLLESDIPGAIAGLRSDLKGTLKQLEQALPEVLNLLSDARSLVAEVRPDLVITMTRLREAAWQLQVATSKLRADPSTLLFGDSEQLVEPGPGESTGLRRTGRVGPYRQRSEKDVPPR